MLVGSTSQVRLRFKAKDGSDWYVRNSLAVLCSINVQFLILSDISVEDFLAPLTDLLRPRLLISGGRCASWVAL